MALYLGWSGAIAAAAAFASAVGLHLTGFEGRRRLVLAPSKPSRPVPLPTAEMVPLTRATRRANAVTEVRLNQDFAYCYCRLVHVGLTWGPFDVVEGQDGAPRADEPIAWSVAVGGWEKDLAEPFFEEMRRRSRVDGLLIRTWIGSDNFLADVRQNRIAFAELTRPNGGHYKGRGLFFGARGFRSFAEDWGQVLVAARQANPYDFSRERAEAERNMRIDELGGWKAFTRLHMRGDPRADGIV